MMLLIMQVQRINVGIIAYGSNPNISNVTIKFSQVLKRSIEQSVSTKYEQTRTSNDRSTLKNLTREAGDVSASRCLMIITVARRTTY